MKGESFKRALALVLIGFFCAQCGSDTRESSKVSVAISPGKPAVRTTDISIVQNLTTISIPHPWFTFNMQLTNTADAHLFVVGIKASVQYSKSGKIETAEQSLGPADFLCGTDFCTEYITEVSNDTTAKANISQVGPIYISALPDPQVNGADSYFYQVTITLEGSFGPALNSPTANFTKQFTFSTTAEF